MRIKDSKTDEGKTIDWATTSKLTIELIKDIQNNDKPVFLVQSFSSNAGELSLDGVIMTENITIDGMKLTPPDKTIKAISIKI